jgi:hypothetical protein
VRQDDDLEVVCACGQGAHGPAEAMRALGWHWRADDMDHTVLCPECWQVVVAVAEDRVARSRRFPPTSQS